MPVPPRYGVQTTIGAVVILIGAGFVGAQVFAPPASTGNSTQAVATTRPAPRIIEINTKREDIKREEPAAEPAAAPVAAPVAPPAAKPLEQAATPIAPPPGSLAPGSAPPGSPAATALAQPQFAEPGPSPVSAAELKRKAQEEADQTADVSDEPVRPRRAPSRQPRYPKYDRHAVY